MHWHSTDLLRESNPSTRVCYYWNGVRERRQINASALAFNENHFCPIYGASESFTHRDAVKLQLSNERSTASKLRRRGRLSTPAPLKRTTTYVNQYTHSVFSEDKLQPGCNCQDNYGTRHCDESLQSRNRRTLHDSPISESIRLSPLG